MPTASPRLARKSAQRTLIPRPIVAIQEIWRAHDWQARHLRRGADRDAGVGFTGIQPVGTRIDPVVTAADEAIAQGSDSDLLPMVPHERRAELDTRFHTAVAIKDFDVDDVAAGRRYLAAYVSFFKYAEGEDHEHHGHEHLVHSAHGHGHEH